jgi:acyl-phosphate glycerol 3-phosphate acyltransferase
MPYDSLFCKKEHVCYNIAGEITMRILYLFLVEFLAGSIMFSYIIGKLFDKDIRQFGDGNPGSFNLKRALGLKASLIGSVLDYSKGAFPLYYIIHHYELNSYQIAIIAVAPILGHMFSPMLKFKGGKAVSVSFGVWTALTDFVVALFYATMVVVFILVFHKNYEESPEYNAIRINFSFLVTGIFIFFYFKSLFLVWAVNFLLLLFAHRRELYSAFESFAFRFKNP